MLKAFRKWLNKKALEGEVEARAKSFGLVWYALDKGLPPPVLEAQLVQAETNLLHSRVGRAFYQGSVEALGLWREVKALKGLQK